MHVYHHLETILVQKLVFWHASIIKKNRRAYVDNQNWQTGLTGARKRSDRSNLFQVRQSAGGSDWSDRSNWNPSTIRTFYRFRSVIGFLAR